MKAKANKTNITFTGIANESQLESVTYCAEKSKCKYKQEDFATKVVVTGTPEQLKTFTNNWNK